VLKLNNSEQFTKQFSLETGENTFIIKAESQFGRSKVLTLTVSKEESPIPTTLPPTPLNLKVDIEVQKKDAAISVTSDNNLSTSRVYKVGSTLVFTANSSITITTNLPTSLAITINGVAQTFTTSPGTWTLVNGQVTKNKP
jgi:hypothetical protein